MRLGPLFVTSSLMCAAMCAAMSTVSCKSPAKLPTAPVITSFSPANEGRAARTDLAVQKAFEWAQKIVVDPRYVRDELGMKGKKHFVEKVQLLRLVAEWSRGAQVGKQPRKDKRMAARAEAVRALSVVLKDNFHGLENADERRFREDAMSYLRAIWLARRLGFDTAPIKSQITAILPRLALDTARRGPDQRMSIAFLLTELGFASPETQQDIYPQSRIGSKIDPRHWQKHPSNSYDLTHEIFAMTHRGKRPFPFRDESERRYAKAMARSLLGAHMKMNNPDIAAELLINRKQLGEPYDPQFDAARKFLLAAQNPDGSFGKYDEQMLRKRKNNPKYSASIGGYLHTTMVCIWALMETS